MTDDIDDIKIEENSIIPTEKMLPGKLLVISLEKRPIFPGIFTPMMIEGEEEVKTVEKAYDDDGFLGIVLAKNDETEKTSVSDLYRIGTAVRIIKKVLLPDGGVNIFVSTIKRFRI